MSYIERKIQAWSLEEVDMLLCLVGKVRKKWCQIASEMPGRIENQVKNKFYCLEKQRRKKKKQNKMASLSQWN